MISTTMFFKSALQYTLVRELLWDGIRAHGYRLIMHREISPDSDLYIFRKKVGFIVLYDHAYNYITIAKLNGIDRLLAWLWKYGEDEWGRSLFEDEVEILRDMFMEELLEEGYRSLESLATV